MIPHEALINRLRELGYEYKLQTDRVVIYKKKGSITRVAVRRKDLLDVTYVKSVLKQAGLVDSDIETFVGAAAKSLH